MSHNLQPKIGPQLKYLAYALIILLVVSVVVGLAIYRPWESPPQTIRVGLLKITPSLRYWVANDKGFFAKHGLKVEIKDDYFSTNQVADDLAAGRIDAGHFAVSTVFQYWSIDPGKMYIFTLDLNTPEDHIDDLFVPADSTIVRVEELRSKRIGKFPGEQATIVLKSYLLSKGFRPDEIILDDIAPQNQVSVLQTKQVTALYAYEPIATLIKIDNIARPLVSGVTLQILNPFPGGAGSFSSKFAVARPNDAKQFILAINEATDYVNDPANRQEVSRILSEKLSIRYDVAQRTKWLIWQPVDKVDVSKMKDYMDFQVTQGQLPRAFDISQLFYHEK